MPNQSTPEIDRSVKRRARLAIRDNADGSLDDFVAWDVRSVHIEQMSENAWWCGITLDNGEDVALWFSTPRATIAGSVTDYPADFLDMDSVSKDQWQRRPAIEEAVTARTREIVEALRKQADQYHVDRAYEAAHVVRAMADRVERTFLNGEGSDA